MITVVNMIPKSMSDEANQDSEPNLTVNPVNTLQIAGSAFTPNPQGGNAPIYISGDGGNTWSLNPIVPSSEATADITLRFSNNYLYAAIIPLPVGVMPTINILRTKDFMGSVPMELLSARQGVDQPWVQVITNPDGNQKDKDLLYVGNNDIGNAPLSATIDMSLDAASPSPTINPVRIDSRNGITNPQDAPSIRPAIHNDGKVYAAFYEWTASSGHLKTSNVVIVRDDNFGMGPSSSVFSALRDPSDGKNGLHVVNGIQVPFDTLLGLQRVGSDLSLVVDPINSSTVYLSYADQNANREYTLHVIRSNDGGSTWSKDLRTIQFATNPAIAINSSGKVGFLYQQFINNRWDSHFETTTDGFKTKQDSLLATVPGNDPPRQFSPYLGDYVYLLSLKNDFYGIFSTSNAPDKNNFPSGITYQRNVDFDKHKLLGVDGVTDVRHSIDPFFFKVT
jgi:hypothetical protein